MAHRRTPSTMYSVPATKQQPEGDNQKSVLNASGVALGISAVLSSAATIIAPALPLAVVSPSASIDRHSANDGMSTASSSSSSLSDDDYMSMSSLDLQAPTTPPLTPGTPSKFFPHPPRFPTYASEPPSRSALVKVQYSFRRFASRLLATVSPRAPGLPLKSPHLSPSGSHSYLASLLTRTHAPIRRRATFFALLTLIAICTWTLFTSSLGDTQSRTRPYSDGVMRTWVDWRNKVQVSEGDERARLLNSASFRSASHTTLLDSNPGVAPLSPLDLSPADELAALTAFIAALPWNALPSHVDPSRPLDPTIILDFDPSHPRARDELTALRKETWQLNPVVLFGKSRHPPTRELRAILEGLSVDVKKGIMEVDMAERVDGDIVLGILGRLVSSFETDSSPEGSNRIELPLLIVNGRPIRGDDVPNLVETGELPRLLREANVRMAVPGRKKKGH